MRINQNIAAFNAYRNLNNTQNSLSSSLEKLSSGFRINRAADDASGLVNSENLRSQIGGLKVATRNAQDAISMVQTAEGAMTEVHSALQRMRDLVVEAGNLAPNDDTSLQASQDEINQLIAELDRIGEQTQFGTKKILDGTFAQKDALAQAELQAISTTTSAGDASATATLDFETIAPVGQANSDLLNRDIVITLEHDSAEAEVAVEFNFGESAEEAATNFAAAVNALSAAEKVALNIGESSVAVVGDTTVMITDLTGDAATKFTVGGQAQAVQTGGAIFQVGANADQRVDVELTSVKALALGQDAEDLVAGAGSTDIEFANVDALRDALTKVNTDDPADLSTAMDNALRVLDKAIEDVSSQRAELGAFQNRMESTIRNLSVAVENLSAAESRIRDTDMALEMVEFTRNQILSQAGTAMLAQANVVPQSVLSLLG